MQKKDKSEVTKVYFEVTNSCNFRCDFCPSYLSERKRQHMDFALFEKGIDDIIRDGITDTVGFHILGEPLLYPRLEDAVRYAKRRGLRTEINTNGSLLTEERIQALADAGLDMLSVSVQLTNRYNHAARGSDIPFDRYYRQMMEIAQAVGRLPGAMEVVLCLMNTATKKYFDIDRPMRINGTCHPYKDTLASFILDVAEAIDLQIVPEQVRRALRGFNVLHPRFIRLNDRVIVYAQPFGDWGNAFTSRKIYPAQVGFCGYALHNVGILNNGEVTICCADYDGKTSLGNLHDASLGAILASEEAQAIRDGFARMRVVHPYCQRCLGGTSKGRTVFKELASIYLFKLLGFQPADVDEMSLVLA